MIVGRVRSLHRYPVKSLVGEPLDHAAFDHRGILGDRLWSVRDEDGKLGSGKSTRRFRKMDGLLDLVATYDGDVPVIEFPDGRVLVGPGGATDTALSDHVGRSVTLAQEEAVSHFDEGPLHLVTTATVRALERRHGRPVDARRLRPNLVIETSDEGFVEDAWIDRDVSIGQDVVLRITAPMPRCVMVDLAQRGVDAEDGLLRTATSANDAEVGVVADVLQPGEVNVGDEVRLSG